MTVIFLTTVLLWLFRDPGFLPGWAQWFKHIPLDDGTEGDPYVSDATVAVVMAILVYMIPAVTPKFLSRGASESKSSPALLDWDKTQHGCPWGVLILIGGGFALAEASGGKF